MDDLPESAESIGGLSHVTTNLPFIFMSTLLIFGDTLGTTSGFATVATNAEPMNGGNPMLSTLPPGNILVNRNHAARRIAAWIASAFVPTGNLTPMSNEALCYGCMAGIVMPIHTDIAPCDFGHDDQAFKLNADSNAIPEPVTIAALGQETVDCDSAGVLHEQVREARDWHKPHVQRKA